jgi:hypothetical protein
MAEGAIIAMVMVILLASMWAAVNYERTKLQVMDQARVAAWQKSLQTCAGDEDVLTDVADSSADAASDAPPDTGSTGDFISLPGLDVFKSAGYAEVDLQKQVQFPGVIGGQTYSMHGKMYMRCNEPKKNDDGEKYFKIVLAAGVALYAILAIF